MSQRFTLGFSPCPNDTFIFDALVNDKIDHEGFEFDVVLEDVETLNELALKGKLDITKLSFPAFFRNSDQYVLLNSGSALGKGVGPLLITKDEKNKKEAINELTIAIPGKYTTANLLLNFAFPAAWHKVPMIFSAIEDAVLNDRTDLGVIIHENRFTYEQKGLHKVVDLGEYWEKKMHLPIPLGGIAIRKQIDKKTSSQIDDLIRKSITHAFKYYPTITEYVKKYSASMEENVMRQHIELYVNDFSRDLGVAGKNAIKKLFEVFNEMEISASPSYSSTQLFLEA
jgi:1,4-dihydroxy-6-naphthoate synthase